MKLSPNTEEFLEYQNYMKERLCNTFGIPSYLIEGYKETRWQKINRNIRSFLWRIGERFKRKKKNKGLSEKSLQEIIVWMEIGQQISKKL